MLKRLPPVASSGLTLSVTAYTSGDVLGLPFVFPNAVDAAGGRGIIRAIALSDAAHVMGAFDAFFFRDTVTATTDNAVSNISVADQAKFIGAASATIVNAGSVSNGVTGQCLVPYDCLATSLSVVLVTRTGNSFFVAATDLALTLWVDVGANV